MFELLSPLSLAITLLSPLLVLAYLKKDQAKTKLVPSLLILKKLKNKKSFSRKPELPPRFFLELAILCLLALSAAMPTLNSGKDKVAVILDNSLSMSAQTKDGSTLERAVSKLGQWLEENNSGNEFYFFTSNSENSNSNTSPSSKEQLISIAKEVKAQSQPDKINSVLRNAINKKEFDRILVVSDKNTEYLENEAGYGNKRTIIENIFVDSKSSNLYISGLRIEKNRKLVSNISLSGITPVEFSADLYLDDPRLAGKSLYTKKGKVVPNHSTEINFNLPPNLEPNTKFRIEISPEQNRFEQNSITIDDFASINVDTVKKRKILLVSQTQTGLGLEKIKDFELEQTTPEKLAQLNKEDYALLIFYKTTPQSFIKTPSIFVLPPEDNSLFPVNLKTENPKISSWKAEHPITTYLNVPIIKPNAALSFELPLWAQAVIGSEKGPILIAGEGQGIRLAAVGFEIFPFEGAKTPAFSVLTLNLLKWLENKSTLKNNGTKFYPSESSSFQSKSFQTNRFFNHESTDDDEKKGLWSQLLFIALLLLLAESLILFLKRKEAK